MEMTLQEAREIASHLRYYEGQDGTSGLDASEVEQLAWARAMLAGAEQAGTEEYRRGFCDGTREYAYTSSEPWAESGVQYVGTTGTTLRRALERVEETHNYSPGQTRIPG